MTGGKCLTHHAERPEPVDRKEPTMKKEFILKLNPEGMAALQVLIDENKEKVHNYSGNHPFRLGFMELAFQYARALMLVGMETVVDLPPKSADDNSRAN
jgi:hypothetical protein